MKMVLAEVALLSLVVVACGKDDETPVAGATPRAAVATQSDQSTEVAAPGFETPSSVLASPSTASTPEASGTRIEIESVSGTVGRNATLDITMRDATDGLAGFKLEVSVADPAIARIVGVGFSDFGLSDAGPLPAVVLSLSAVDLSSSFEGAFDRETIATLELDLLTSGETEIVLKIVKLDDDKGNVVSAEAVHGQLFVTDTGSRP